MDSPPSYNASIPKVGVPQTLSYIPEEEEIYITSEPTDPKQNGKAAIAPFAAFMCIPCLWVHALIMTPCIAYSYISSREAAKNTQFALTNRAVYSHVEDHASCPCCSCCCTHGEVTKSVPLEKITDAQIRNTGTGCLNRCFDVETLVVETAGDATNMVLVGAQDSKEFKSALLEIRKRSRDAERHVVVSSGTVQQQPTFEKKRFKAALEHDPSKGKLCLTGASWDDTLSSVRRSFNLPDTASLTLLLKDGMFEIDNLDLISANDDIIVRVN